MCNCTMCLLDLEREIQKHVKCVFRLETFPDKVLFHFNSDSDYFKYVMSIGKFKELTYSSIIDAVITAYWKHVFDKHFVRE